MEGFAKVLLILTVCLCTLSMVVEGGRTLKGKEEVVDHPQTFGSFGGLFPPPGFGGAFPSPTFGGSFPSPNFGGSFPGPGFGSGSNFPSPGLGFGPSSFCSFPGVRCAPVQPSEKSGPVGGATVRGSP